MCGIFAWIPSAQHKRHDVIPVARRLIAALKHRGPNDSGQAVFPDERNRPPGVSESDIAAISAFRLLLGQTRLSILDLSFAGHQPMASADGRYHLIYNGEVYNYLELRTRLEAEGVVFSSNTDTEVVLYACIRWGKEALGKFVGMFSFLLFDSRENTLLCARDLFGIKPFYYCSAPTGVFIASELPALLAFPGIPRAVDPVVAYQYLRYGKYDIGDMCMAGGIKQLPPAHTLEMRLSDTEQPVLPEPQRYWQPDLSQKSRLSFSEAAERLRGLFLESVRIHLRSDVPVGVALSGGVDSSAVTCAVRHLLPDAELHAFSYSAKGSPVDEWRWAALVGDHVDATMHAVDFDAKCLASDLDAMILSMGEPVGSTAIYAQRRVFKAVRDSGVTVILEGQGADEMLAGYFGYPRPRLSSLLRKGRYVSALRFLFAVSRLPGNSLRQLSRWLGQTFILDYAHAFLKGEWKPTPVPEWLDWEALRGRGVNPSPADVRDVLFPHYDTDRLRQALAYQLTWDGIPSLLRHGDRNSMAFSVESRLPFLTRDLVEFCLSLPEEYLVDMRGNTKAVFRQAMRGLVPDSILDRKDKIGFATPEASWLRQERDWVDSILVSAADVPFLKVESVRKKWRETADNGRPFGFQIWRWINYIRWYELVISQTPTVCPVTAP